MIDLGEDEDKFDDFMDSICTQLDRLVHVLITDFSNNYNNNVEEAKKSLIGIARDLRGIAFAFNTKLCYMMLFECLYPNYTPVFSSRNRDLVSRSDGCSASFKINV